METASSTALKHEESAKPESVSSRQPGRTTVLWVVVALLISLGLGARVAPLLNREGRLLEQFPTEDGYLMLTIARNIALGRGMSIAEGTIPTNGTQPLATFIWSACFAAVGGDRAAGVFWVLVVSTVVSALAAWCLYRLGCRVLVRWPEARLVSALTAALWFASTLTIGHSMNCLETGLYMLAVLVVARLFYEWHADGTTDWNWRRCVAFGVALGAAFWVRIDAVFLIAAVCFIRVASGLGLADRLRRRVGETFIFGLVSVLVATPWLINNLRFGSIMPISGQAESAGARLGGNLRFLPLKLAEYVSVVVGIPSGVEDKSVVLAGASLVVLAALAVMGVAWWRASGATRSLMSTFTLYGALLCTYYGLFFGAPHFVARYLAPLSPFIALFVMAALAQIWIGRFGGRPGPALVWVLCMSAVAGFGAVRMYGNGSKHQHFQVKEWIDANTSQEDWVGAIQTGTIGFFHERTINLDGKVNPAALRANREKRLQAYVVHDTPIRFLADWRSLAEWRTLPEVREAFDLIVDDPAANLAVFRRKANAAPLAAAGR